MTNATSILTNRSTTRYPNNHDSMNTTNSYRNDDHHKSYASSPNRRTDSCHPSGEGAAAASGRHRGGGAHPC